MEKVVRKYDTRKLMTVIFASSFKYINSRRHNSDVCKLDLTTERTVEFTFRGLIAPVFATFNNDKEKTLNLQIIPQYVKYLKKQGINGVLVNGTSGEGMSMNVAERKQIAEAWISASDGLHVMVQVGGAALPDVLLLAKHAENSGAHSMLCLPDLYNKPATTEQLINYLKIVGQSAPNTPLLYYHIPMFTNVNLHMGKFLNEINVSVPSFGGIKFTSNDLAEGMEAVLANNRMFAVFLGADTLMLGSYALGFDSAIATTLNIYPEMGISILKDGLEGRQDIARKTQEKLSKTVSVITKYGAWVPTMKAAMNLLTPINCGPVRNPIVGLTDEEIVTLSKELKLNN